MNVAFVIPYFYPAWQYGGQPRSAYELARALVRRGHRVKVLTTDSCGEKRIVSSETGNNGRRTIEGVNVIYYRNVSNFLAYRQRIFWSPNLVRHLTEELREMDLVHIHELRSTITVPAYHAIRKLSLPYVLSTHGGLRHLGRKGLKVVFDAVWGNRILRDASAVLAISPIEELDALRMNVGRSRIRRLPNAISVADYERLPEAGFFKRRLGLESKRIVLFLGRLHWIKGADLLIRAFQRLVERHPDVHVVISGPDDGQGSELRRLVSEAHLASRIQFTGFLDVKTKIEALVDAEFLAIPSRSDVFALSAVEALICGCPVLVSDACGLDPMPQPDHGVQRFRSEDVDDLEAKLDLMLKDFPRRFAEAGRRFVMREFGAARMGEQAENIYAEVLQLSEKVVS